MMHGFAPFERPDVDPMPRETARFLRLERAAWPRAAPFMRRRRVGRA
jgi:hypothetical protein